MNDKIFKIKEEISQLSAEVESLSSLAVSGMLLGELVNYNEQLLTKSNTLTLKLLELDSLEDFERNNSKLDDFKGEY